METQSAVQSIVVLDFGAQYSQLIARRIRELKIFSVVLPFNATLEEIRSYSPVGIILSRRTTSRQENRRFPRSRADQRQAAIAGKQIVRVLVVPKLVNIISR